MLLKLKLIGAALLAGIIVVLWFMLGRAEKRAAAAERAIDALRQVRKTEHDTRKAVEAAEEKANEEIKQAVDHARDGHRDHFG